MSVYLEVPVWRPTMDEFSDFSRFIRTVWEKSVPCGMMKIVPPPEWRQLVDPVKSYEKAISVLIPAPVKQVLSGSKGRFQQAIVEQDAMTVLEFEAVARATEQENRLEGQDLPALEEKLWKTIHFVPPLYGADMSGSLMGDEVTTWNLKCLNSLLDLVQEPMPGINDPYLYFGMWKAKFGWHTEDLDLNSINYLHFGKPKQWYCVPASHSSRFERVIASLFPDQDLACKAFLRHKTTVVKPSLLSTQYALPVYACVQNEGEFMVTFPNAYHSGFNYGFNCAESVNFATEEWIPYGLNFKPCTCVRGQARIDMDIFIARHELVEKHGKDFAITDEALWGKMAENGVNKEDKEKQLSDLAVFEADESEKNKKKSSAQFFKSLGKYKSYQESARYLTDAKPSPSETPRKVKEVQTSEAGEIDVMTEGMDVETNQHESQGKSELDVLKDIDDLTKFASKPKKVEVTLKKAPPKPKTATKPAATSKTNSNNNNSQPIESAPEVSHAYNTRRGKKADASTKKITNAELDSVMDIEEKEQSLPAGEKEKKRKRGTAKKKDDFIVDDDDIDDFGSMSDESDEAHGKPGPSKKRKESHASSRPPSMLGELLRDDLGNGGATGKKKRGTKKSEPKAPKAKKERKPAKTRVREMDGFIEEDAYSEMLNAREKRMKEKAKLDGVKKQAGLSDLDRLFPKHEYQKPKSGAAKGKAGKKKKEDSASSDYSDSSDSDSSSSSSSGSSSSSSNSLSEGKSKKPNAPLKVVIKSGAPPAKAKPPANAKPSSNKQANESVPSGQMINNEEPTVQSQEHAVHSKRVLLDDDDYEEMERAKKEKLEAEEKERHAKEEQERLHREELAKKEQERKERKEKERAEKAEQAKIEKEKRELERAEREAKEKEAKERHRKEKEERERLMKERREREEKAKQERLERERVLREEREQRAREEQARREKEEADRIEAAAREAKERAERIKREKEERERREAERRAEEAKKFDALKIKKSAEPLVSSSLAGNKAFSLASLNISKAKPAQPARPVSALIGKSTKLAMKSPTETELERERREFEEKWERDREFETDMARSRGEYGGHSRAGPVGRGDRGLDEFDMEKSLSLFMSGDAPSSPAKPSAVSSEPKSASNAFKAAMFNRNDVEEGEVEEGEYHFEEDRDHGEDGELSEGEIY